MGIRAAVAFTSAVLAVAAACSTFDEADPEPGNDAGLDVGVDVLPIDAPSGDGGPSAAWIPCSMRGTQDPAHFCDDFDRQGGLTFGWNALVLDGDGSGAFFEAGTSGTPPMSFRARLPANPSPPGRAQLRLARPMPASRYRMELDVRVDSIPHPSGTSGFSHIAVIQFDDAPCLTGTNAQRAIELSMYPNGERVLVAGKGLKSCPGGDAAALPTSFDLQITPAQLVDGTFRRLSFDLRSESCPTVPSKASLYASFGALRSSCIPVEADIFGESATVDTFVGAYAGSAGYAEMNVVYDNVTVDLD